MHIHIHVRKGTDIVVAVAGAGADPGTALAGWLAAAQRIGSWGSDGCIRIW